jgi:hypothetical protein
MTTDTASATTSATRDNLATASLAFGIAGLLPVLPFLGSIAALVCGYAAGRDDDTSGDRARIGLLLGWLGLAAPVVALFVYCVVLGYPFPIHRYRPDS